MNHALFCSRGSFYGPRLAFGLLLMWGMVFCSENPLGAAEAKSSPIGRKVEDFRLQDYLGKWHRLSDFASSRLVVVAFLGTECPLAKLYGPRLGELRDEYASKGVQFLGINANQQDSITEMAAYARVHHLKFPLLKDLGNRVADQMQAVRTPEVFVLDADRRIRYWGRIDDQYGVGYSRDVPDRQDLRIAIDELLSGKPVSRAVTRSIGCYIGRIRRPDESSKITYSKQISRIFQKQCVECHRPGEIAPFTLMNYDDVVGWGETIAEVIRDQRMPPWHADPAHGKFSNERRMTDEEKKLVYDWVAAGCPRGEPNELPEPQQYVTGWQLPQPPDQTIAMRAKPFRVPAEGTVKYQYFVVDPKFEEDKWIAAAEVIPGNRAVVHHAVIFVRPPDGTRSRGFGWVAGYVPGQRVAPYPEGSALMIPAGSKFVFQMHYTPIGSVQEDLTKLGLVFTEAESVEREIITMVVANQTFEIPPFAGNHRVEARVRRIPKNGKLLAMFPHMHLRGKSFRIVASLPDGNQEVLLDVPHYDFNWQTDYRLADPKEFPKGTQLKCVAHFDNSEENLTNPDPSAPVRWGDQTWEEMLVGYFEVSIPKGQNAFANRRKLTKEDLKKANATADRIFARLDVDKDGKALRKEVALQFSIFAFRRYDTNKDKIITRDEILEAVKKSRRRRKR